MHPSFLEIGPITIYSYGFMLCIAFIAGIILSLREAPAEGIPQEHLYDIFILVMILSLIGARLVYVLLNWSLYSGSWQTIFAYREGGLTFMGGLLLALVGGFYYCRYRKVDYLRYMDFLIPYVALGYAIARIGCFLNGCCYGQVTDKPWGVVLPAVDSMHRHPTQLYAALAGLIIFLLLRLLKKHKTFPGFIFAHYLLLYGVYRFILEFFRVDKPLISFLTPGQIASLLLIITGALLLHWHKKEPLEKTMQN